jgi:LytS/YehU family sensor histidine kinase
MNPHFIFNSLNSIQQFILERDNEKAFFYLTRFSKLIRRLLESNRSETISLEEEMDLLKKYLEIESMRFDQAFNYKIVHADGLIPSNIKIPHMMIQPFVENAIWHGLLHKHGERNLQVSFSCVNNEILRCVVDDDGVGRKAESEKNKKGRKSLGIEFIKERLELMSNNYRTEFNMAVIDKKDLAGKPLGTRVEITLPIMQQ